MSRCMVRAWWLPVLLLSIASAAAAATPPVVLAMVGEPEYGTELTLPAFALSDLAPRGIGFRLVQATVQDPDHFPGLEALAEADLLLVSVRRRALAGAQLALIRAHLAAGRPLVGIRTASHAFAGKPRDGLHVAWPGFDREVLGGSYQGHYGDEPAQLSAGVDGAGHPILAGVDAAALVTSRLYRNPTLAPGAVALLVGRSRGATDSQHVAWTHMHGGSRVFATSLGAQGDFAQPGFRRLLANGIAWALQRPATD